jgi:hypothetical protein
MAGPAPAERVPHPGQAAWPYGLELRARAVGLVGVGWPVREVTRLVGCTLGRCAAGSGRPRGGGQTRSTSWTSRTSRTRTRTRMLDRTSPAVPGPAAPCKAPPETREKGPDLVLPLPCPCRVPGCPPRTRSYSAALPRRHLHRLAPGSLQAPPPGSPAESVGRHHRKPSRAICATSQLRRTPSSARIRLIDHPCSRYLRCR